MAELSAAVALATAVANLSHFVYGQARVVLDVDNDIRRLTEELKWMQSFLKDAENKRDTSHLIQQWMSDVRDLAYNCEDVIDTFLIELREPEAMSSCISYLKNLHSTSKLSSQVKKLQRKANNISIRQNRYHLKPDAHRTDGNLMDLRRTTPYAHDEHMVGQSETIGLLTAKLKNGESGHFIISIFGMGGLGKTTLARKLYDKLGQQYFKSCAWICNPQVSDARASLLQLIKSMIKPSKEDLEGLDSIDSVELYLHNFLSGCRFLLVIDDLWEREAWESLKRAFPDNVNGSRVIITTRKMEVAAMNNAYVHEMRYLNEDESWRLFCKKAFLHDNDMIISSPIAHVGKEMVEKCLGLPLAIVTLGGLLSTKSNTLSEWTLVRDNLWKQLAQKDSTHINALLLLSFRDLPYYLKPCFLYIGMFPENYEIPVSKLILLWVAEGFIESEMRWPESVAKSYFNELVGRSLFQKNGEDWIDSTFRVHGLLRDLAIKKAKEICFSVYYDEDDMFNLTKAAPHKRLSSFHPTFSTLPREYTNPSLRTLSIGSTGVTTGTDPHMDGHQFLHICSNEVLRSVHKRFGLLRVLDIQVRYGDDFKPQRLPSKIGSLLHLRYLGLHLLKSAVKELPHSICNLKALQTISVKSDPILPYLTLPKTMGKLQSLRHLIGNFGLADWIEKLVGLVTLQEITYEQWCGIDTTNMFHLRHLSLTNVPQLHDSSARFYEKFQTTKKLQTLSLENPEVFELASISVSEIFKCCPNITHFKTSGIKFENSSDLHVFARNLEVLDLVYYKNPEDDPIPSIERLPALRALRMEYYNACAQKIVCSERGFPKLQTLIIEIDHNVTFLVAKGGMRNLTCLRTKTSHNLEAPKRLMDLIVMF